MMFKAHLQTNPNLSRGCPARVPLKLRSAPQTEVKAGGPAPQTPRSIFAKMKGKTGLRD